MEQPSIPQPQQRSRVSLFATVFSIALVVLLIRFTDIALFDLNRVLNPLVIEHPTFEQSLRLNMDAVTFSNNNVAAVSYLSSTQQEYTQYKFLIYAAVLLPIILLIAAVWFGAHKGTPRRDLHILYHAFAAYALWMLLSLLRFGTQIAREQYQHLSVYATLIIMIIVCAALIVFSQRRKNRSN